jgi:tyrosine-specific transport protein
MKIGRSELKTFLYPLATMCNTIIGVGIFSLPYIAAKVGLPLMFAYFLLLGSLVIAIHIMYCEISLKTADYKRLAGFSKIYLGEWGRSVAVISNIVGFFGILVAFMIVGGQFLYQFVSPLLGGSEAIYSLVYFAVGAVLIYFGINTVSRVGLWGLLLFFIIFFILALKGLPYFSFQNLGAITGTAGDFFLPYGAVLFSLWASSSIPEVEEMLGKKDRKDLLKPVVLTASAIALATYILFIVMIVGITGPATTQSAFIGLKQVFGENAASLFFLFGLITSFTSFIIVGLTLRKILTYDLRIEKHIAWGLVALVPIVLFLTGFKNFIDIFSLVGGVLLGLDGILILLMYRKIRPERKWIIYPLLLIFIGGIIYELVYFLK